MSLSKVDRANYGPSWLEIILSIVLCIGLGALLACIYLILKPVATVTKLPDPNVAPGQVTYIEGSRDTYKGSGWVRKRQSFLAGQSVDVSEEELNVAVSQADKSSKPAPAPVPEPSKPGQLKQKPKAPPPPPAQEKSAWDEPYLVPGSINFRVADKLLQVSLPVRIPLLDKTVIVQAAGTFQKGSSGVFEYVPERFHVGSLPVHMIPRVSEELVARIMQSESLPSDMKEAWAKVSDARIEGRVLKVDQR